MYDDTCHVRLSHGSSKPLFYLSKSKQGMFRENCEKCTAFRGNFLLSLAVLGSPAVFHDTIINSRSSQKMIHHLCEMSGIFEVFYLMIGQLCILS